MCELPMSTGNIETQHTTQQQQHCSNSNATSIGRSRDHSSIRDEQNEVEETQPTGDAIETQLSRKSTGYNNHANADVIQNTVNAKGWISDTSFTSETTKEQGNGGIGRTQMQKEMSRRHRDSGRQGQWVKRCGDD